jgi:RNA polymerase sigma-70 factor (ECF subfamily)
LEDERDITLRAQQGDPDAFADLVGRYGEVAFRVAYLIVRDEAEARDVAQDAFVQAYRSLARFDASRPFRPWLLRIVTNQAINNRRSASRRSAMTKRYEANIDSPAQTGSPERETEAQEEAQRVWQAIGSLDAKDRAVVYLRYFVGASEEETAVALGRPAGTVKSRLHRALRKLRGVIEERYPDLMPERTETRTEA